jgi:hypothetical protein
VIRQTEHVQVRATERVRSFEQGTSGVHAPVIVIRQRINAMLQIRGDVVHRHLLGWDVEWGTASQPEGHGATRVDWVM